MQTGTWNTQSVQQFVNLVSQARAHNSKEVRISITDAQQLCDSICFLLLQERDLSQRLLRAQEQLIHNQKPTTLDNVSLNGGSFR
jgi:hypothetical protein